MVKRSGAREDFWVLSVLNQSCFLCVLRVTSSHRYTHTPALICNKMQHGTLEGEQKQWRWQKREITLAGRRKHSRRVSLINKSINDPKAARPQSPGSLPNGAKSSFVLPFAEGSTKSIVWNARSRFWSPIQVWIPVCSPERSSRLWEGSRGESGLFAAFAGLPVGVPDERWEEEKRRGGWRGDSFASRSPTKTFISTSSCISVDQRRRSEICWQIRDGWNIYQIQYYQLSTSRVEGI